MPEYIERAAAAEFFEKNKKVMWHKDDVAATVSSDAIPAADVVEVVRCKDCKYGEMCFPCKAFGLEALPVYVCRLGHRNREVLPNDYCSCGAKMDGKGEGE